ncbi:MAG: succinylglutamate-semialdehyde dehydrogenase [Gammaproteobacteria bacterium]
MNYSGQHFIQGSWVEGQGELFDSHNSATGEQIWSGHAANGEEVASAVQAARDAFPAWASLSTEARFAYLETFKQELVKYSDELAQSIAIDAAKPLWEARTEVQAMINKITISYQAHEQRSGVLQKANLGLTSQTRHKAHGVIVVLGPFNFPGHLPNGHIIPALLAGNTVIFKPSSLTPLVAEKTFACWQQAGLPAGVINLVQGQRETGELLTHAEIDGVFFTGSYQVGQKIHQQFAGQPHKILALEMGGNNPLVVGKVTNFRAAAYHIVQSAFITAGQRCTCARRLIVPQGAAGDALLTQLIEMAANIKVGLYTDQPEPFMSAVISTQAAQQLLATQAALQTKGAKSLLEMRSLKTDSGLLSPGLIDVTVINDLLDQEIFGPLLQIIRCDNFDAAITIANNTEYGLAAGLLSEDNHQYEKFYSLIRAGIVNWNTPLTGASSELPFGGVGHSGNHRPSAFYAADYCAYPVAGQLRDHLNLPEKILPGINLRYEEG